jgi:hypothetical protein
MCVAAKSKVRARVRGTCAGSGSLESGREREKAQEGTERGWAGDPLGALTSNGY